MTFYPLKITCYPFGYLPGAFLGMGLPEPFYRIFVLFSRIAGQTSGNHVLGNSAWTVQANERNPMVARDFRIREQSLWVAAIRATSLPVIQAISPILIRKTVRQTAFFGAAPMPLYANLIGVFSCITHFSRLMRIEVFLATFARAFASAVGVTLSAASRFITRLIYIGIVRRVLESLRTFLASRVFAVSASSITTVFLDGFNQFAAPAAFFWRSNRLCALFSQKSVPISNGGMLSLSLDRFARSTATFFPVFLRSITRKILQGFDEVAVGTSFGDAHHFGGVDRVHGDLTFANSHEDHAEGGVSSRPVSASCLTHRQHIIDFTVFPRRSPCPTAR